MQQALSEALGLVGRIQRNGEFGCAGCAKEIRFAAYGQHQCVVSLRPGGKDFLSGSGIHGFQKQLLSLAIYRLELTVNEGEAAVLGQHDRSEEHTSELKSLMRISYAVFCLKKKNIQR